jgi:hypothetical protein
VFELVHMVATTPELHPLPASLIEELFNATFCYFPIRFKRAAHDVGAVSPDTLALKLRDALFSSSVFAPFLFMGLSQRIAGEDEDDDVIAALQVAAVMNMLVTIQQVVVVVVVVDRGGRGNDNSICVRVPP